MGYHIAKKIEEIQGIYSENGKSINDESLGKILAYCILSANRKDTLSPIVNVRNEHATREFKKRHILHIRNKILDFSPDIPYYKKPDFAFNELLNYTITEPRSTNTIEGILDKVLFIGEPGEIMYLDSEKKQPFNIITLSIIEGSKKYGQEAKSSNSLGMNWHLYKEYNKILNELYTNFFLKNRQWIQNEWQKHRKLRKNNKKS